MKNISESEMGECGIFPYLWYFLINSCMFGPYNVSQVRDQILCGRINKDTSVLGEDKKHNSLKNKRTMDPSPLSCFLDLMYDPNSPLSLFFIVELDLKDKIIIQNQEDIKVL